MASVPPNPTRLYNCITPGMYNSYLKLRWRPWFGVIFTGWLVVPMI